LRNRASSPHHSRYPIAQARRSGGDVQADAAETLGEHVFNAFLANKKIEWDTYRTQVTDYEIKKYLPVL